MSLSIVAHATTVTDVPPPASLTITPTAANQLIVVIVISNSSSGSGISSNPSLTWTPQYDTTVGRFESINAGTSAYWAIHVWYAISTSNSSLTITISGSSYYTEALVVDGANLNTPFETDTFPLAAVSLDASNNITATFSTSVTKNELIIAAIAKVYESSGNISFTTSFGNPVFLDGNGPQPTMAFAYIITPNTLSNATFTASWAATDSPGMIVFSILPASVTNYVPFEIVYHGISTTSPITVTPTAANQLILILLNWVIGSGPLIVYSNPPLLWRQLININNINMNASSVILAYYTISTSSAPITINVSGAKGDSVSTEIYDVLIISGVNTINPFDQNPLLPVNFEQKTEEYISQYDVEITTTFSTTSQNSLIIAFFFKYTSFPVDIFLESSIGRFISLDTYGVNSNGESPTFTKVNRATKSLSNATLEAIWEFQDTVNLAIIAIVPQQNVVNAVVPQFEPSLSNATQFSSFFNPPAITNFSYSDAILPVGTQNRKYTFTLYSVTNDQLEDLFRLLQQPSVQLLDVEGVSHTVVITSISPTYTGGLVGIYQVDIEAIEQNA